MLRNLIGLGSLRVIMALSAIAVCPMVGCDRGPKLVDIKGKVNVDGQPTEGIGLLFFDRNSQEIVASSKSGPGGEFTVMTNDRQGMPEGSYVVSASWPDPKHKAPATSFGAEPAPAPDLFNGKYVKTKSDIFLDVTSSTTDPVIELKLK